MCRPCAEENDTLLHRVLVRATFAWTTTRPATRSTCTRNGTRCSPLCYARLQFDATFLSPQVTLSEEEVAAHKAAPEKMALGGDGGFALGPAPKHKIDKERALVVMPAGLRVQLPCSELPELVLVVIEAIVVRGCPPGCDSKSINQTRPKPFLNGQNHESAGTQEQAAVWEEERKPSRC